MSVIVPLMGLETEYGIIRENVKNSDPVDESIALLKRFERENVFGAWTYRRERSHVDQRGFSVSRLAQDEEEDEFCKQDQERPYSYWEMKNDRVLTNGARYYNDHTHPEYSTPECSNVFQLVAHDRAGERIVAECSRLRNRDLGENCVQLFKNNTDYVGHSYGTHDNYLIPRNRPFEYWVSALTSFLVTRQLFAGAGKVGSENKRLPTFSGLQLSQRSDFIECLLSIETMTQRPIINTRDEPHAKPEKYRRLHLILGDANMSPYATALKVGTTQMVLSLIGEGKLENVPSLADPVGDIKKVSRDQTGTVDLKRIDGKTIRPLEIQEWYLEKAKSAYEGVRKDWNWILKEWERTLKELRHHPEKLADRIDWAIKKELFAEFMEAEKLDWEDPWMQSLDLEYHNLDEERGLFRGLELEGGIPPLISEEAVEEAMTQPPSDTRARLRGGAVANRADEIKAIHWTAVEFKDGSVLELSDVICPEDVKARLTTQKEQFA